MKYTRRQEPTFCYNGHNNRHSGQIVMWVFNRRHELPLREHRGSLQDFGEVRVAHLFSFLYYVLFLVSFVFVLCLMCPFLPVSLDCPFLPAPQVLCNVYLQQKIMSFIIVKLYITFILGTTPRLTTHHYITDRVYNLQQRYFL